MRVITSSTFAMSCNPLYQKDSKDENDNENIKKFIKVFSSVLRLGRSGASTDHSSIFYNVDISTGQITHGTTNAHWYKLGFQGLSTPWRGYDDINDYKIHIDPPHPQVVGKSVPFLNEALEIVTK